MIKFEYTEVVGWEHAIRGMRNPMNSWEKSDSFFCQEPDEKCSVCEGRHTDQCYNGFVLGPNDLDLMKRLCNAGTDHRKFMRMIVVYADLTAPMYWWSEYDTYKIGTVANSTSKMHKMLAKPFEMNDFSFDKLPGWKNEVGQYIPDFDYDKEIWKEIGKTGYEVSDLGRIRRGDRILIVDTLNELRDTWIRETDETKKKQIWYAILQLLPVSYNQRRTVMLNYEVLANIYKSRKDHKLDEWREFCEWIEGLPYSEIVTGKECEV